MEKIELTYASGKPNSPDCIEHGYLSISVGQYYHEGKYLQAAVDWLSKKFNRCSIFVCDSLQRRNIEIESTKSPADIYKESLQKGDAWLERNQSILEMLEIPFSIVRWDDWRLRDDFEKEYNFIKSLYEQNSEFREIVDNDLSIYLQRLIRRNPNISYEKAHALSLPYIFEEEAVNKLQAENGITHEIYPGPEHVSTIYLRERYYKQTGKPLFERIELRFRKKPVTVSHIMQTKPHLFSANSEYRSMLKSDLPQMELA